MKPLDESVLAECAREAFVGQHERMIGADEASREWVQLPPQRKMDYRKSAERSILRWKKAESEQGTP